MGVSFFFLLNFSRCITIGANSPCAIIDRDEERIHFSTKITFTFVHFHSSSLIGGFGHSIAIKLRSTCANLARSNTHFPSRLTRQYSIGSASHMLPLVTRRHNVSHMILPGIQTPTKVFQMGIRLSINTHATFNRSMSITRGDIKWVCAHVCYSTNIC